MMDRTVSFCSNALITPIRQDGFEQSMLVPELLIHSCYFSVVLTHKPPS